MALLLELIDLHVAWAVSDYCERQVVSQSVEGRGRVLVGTDHAVALVPVQLAGTVGSVRGVAPTSGQCPEPVLAHSVSATNRAGFSAAPQVQGQPAVAF